MGFSSAAVGNPAAWAPSDNGLKFGVTDPRLLGPSQTPTAGTIYLVKQKVLAANSISNLVFMLASGGTGASTGSFVGVYSAIGNRIGVSADTGTLFTNSFVPITCPLLSTIEVTPPFFWYALLSNLATTQPQINGGFNNGNLTNFNLPPSAYAYCVNGTGQLALPAQINVAANSLAGNLNFWAGSE